MDYNGDLSKIAKELHQMSQGLLARAEKEIKSLSNNISEKDKIEFEKQIAELDHVQGMAKEEVRKAQAAYAKK